MVAKCTNCGGILYPPALPGGLVTCRFCSAPQVARGPTPRPMPAASPDAPLARGPRVVAVLVIVLAAVAFVVSIGASARHGILGTRLDVAALQNVSLAVTPAAMTTATHVPVGNNEYMAVPLSGSTFESISFQWDEADLSHVYAVRLQFGKSPPDVAAITARLRVVLGSRVDASGNFGWEGASAGFSKDDFSVIARVDGGPGSKNPHWKQQLDALWDVVRASALGLKVPVDDDVVRDWLGRGRAPSLLASIDPSTDVDASDAAVRRVFPGALCDPVWTRCRVALDHPLLSEVSLFWEDKSQAELERVEFKLVASEDGATDQVTLEACLQSAYGPPTSSAETEHMKRRHSSTWSLGDRGVIEVDHGGITVLVENYLPVTARSTGSGRVRMATATWQSLAGVLDACGRH